uniref:BMP and activin membrane-bound inhibitor homolog n=1 Tax=Cyprinus carpio TaxID=7962 RepID=A0A8C1W192_CYPCA
MQRNSSPVSIWLQLELCAMAVLLTKGEIRCYCDAPHCVATGYMCKSELNACFTRTLDHQSTKSPLSHGCYDPLLNSRKTSHPEYDTIHGSATLQCCHEDMCNYRGLQDVTYRGSEIHDKRRHQTEVSRHVIARLQEILSSKEVWFRAAVITVPIAGGLVLVLLIMLALRMLHSENRRLRQQRREMLSRLHYSFHGQHLTKVGGHENCCLTCDKIQHSNLSSQKHFSLVSWGKYSGRGKLEFV